MSQCDVANHFKGLQKPLIHRAGLDSKCITQTLNLYILPDNIIETTAGVCKKSLLILPRLYDETEQSEICSKYRTRSNSH